jgi:hypothetical protein
VVEATVDYEVVVDLLVVVEKGVILAREHSAV